MGKITSLESLFVAQTTIWLEHKNGPDGDALYRILNAIIARQDYLSDKPEKLAATDALIARRFTPRCQFDRTHDRLLFDLAVDPARVSTFWKWRERLHRKFCYEHKVGENNMKAFGLILGVTILLFVISRFVENGNGADWSGIFAFLGVVGVVVLISYILIRIRGAKWWPR